MINTMLGVKIGMVSGYDSRGRRVGATVLLIEPNVIAQVKHKDGSDKYDSLQVGFGSRKSLNKPQTGHLKKLGIEQNLKVLREVRIETEGLNPGQVISIGQVFSKGDAVKVTGISKGKGFQGGVRRHGFHGGPKTHGQSDRHRAPGSIGSGTTPGRVYKGKKMAGHMGSETVSYTGLEVLEVDKNKNLIVVKGGVPGARKSLVVIQKQGRIKGYTPPPEEKTEEEEVPATAENPVGKSISESETQQPESTDQSDTSGLPSNNGSAENKEGE